MAKQTSTLQESSSSVLPQPTHYVGIGASAGGLEAIESFFKRMPPKSGLAFIVIQHLSPDYKSLMVELLSKKTEMPVLRAEDSMAVEPDHVYLIPPKKNLTIFHGRLILKEQDSSSGINLPIDIFLRSLAEDQAERAIAIILSGTGSDGARGVRAVKEFNGMVMVQDEETSKFDGMPRAAISTGVADFILAPEEMPDQLMAFVKHPYESRQQAHRSAVGEDALTRIFAELRERTKVDFTFYKPSTIIRRIERRMVISHTSDLDEYLKYMYKYPGEVVTLYRELLIGVTNFFRDPEAMRELMKEHLPGLLNRSSNRELRFWIAGCSTGEEAYTIAMLAKETMESIGASRDIKIFATDLDKDAVMNAGAGIYPESIAADLSPKLLSKYFYRKDDNYQIARSIREMVVFAQHNLVKDPPFTNIDLVSCRNLLIYLQPILQQKAMQMFNFSLNPQGILFLGMSETVGDMTDYFEPLNQKYKIYASKGKHAAGLVDPVTVSQGQVRQTHIIPSFHERPHLIRREENWLATRFIDVLSRHYVPLTMVVNEQMEVIYSIGDTSGVFKLPSGRAVFDITKMATKELVIPLATGIQKVFRTREEILYTNVRLTESAGVKNFKMRLVPLPEKKGQEPLVAVFIEEVKPTSSPEEGSPGSTYDVGEDVMQRIKDLDSELQFTKENLQATIEELETANEELQATNEELLASNEELQSTNEELQSTNEELYTVNSEYQKKINELTELNNDVDNLLTGSRIGKLLLDEDLGIRKFSPEIENIFSIIDKDIGRPINHIAHKIVGFDFIGALRSVQQDSHPVEREVATEDGLWYLMRILPYHIGPKTFSGLFATFVDITQMQKTEAALMMSRKISDDIVNNMPAGLLTYSLDSSGRLLLETSNPEAERLTGIKAKEWAGRPFDEIWPSAAERGISAKVMEVVATGKTYLGEEIAYIDKRITGVYRMQVFKLPDNRLAVTFEDITESKKMKAALAIGEEKYRSLFERMAEGVVYQSSDGTITSANPAAERILGLTLDQLCGRTSLDPQWKAMDEEGNPLPGERHPSMVALKTGKPVTGFVMGVFNPTMKSHRWIMVNATPEFRNGNPSPYQVFATFDDITDKLLVVRASK
jgi:two-component system CheB/CheR fusion protein